MAKAARIILILMTAYVASIIFPALYRSTFQRNQPRMGMHYSEVINKFLFIGQEKDMILDSDGNRYTYQEYERLVPLSAVNQLVKAGEFPDSIQGVPVTPEIAFSTMFEHYVYMSPNKRDYKLRVLTHGGTDRVGFIRTGDMMRVNKHGIQFYNSAAGGVDTAKSELFDRELKQLGYVPPAKELLGNSGGIKRDNGLFFIDQNDRIFQVRYYAYQPIVNEIKLPDGVTPRKMEFPSANDEIVSYIIGSDNVVYILQPEGNLIPLKLDGFDYDTFTQFHLMGHLLYRLVVISKPGYEKMFVYDRNYNLIDSQEISYKTYEQTMTGVIESAIFPAITTTYNYRDGYDFKTHWSPVYCFIWLNLLLAVGLVIIKLVKRRNFKAFSNIADIVLVAAFGILAFVGVFIYPNRE